MIDNMTPLQTICSRLETLSPDLYTPLEPVTFSPSDVYTLNDGSWKCVLHNTPRGTFKSPYQRYITAPPSTAWSGSPISDGLISSFELSPKQPVKAAATCKSLL